MGDIEWEFNLSGQFAALYLRVNMVTAILRVLNLQFGREISDALG